MIAEDERPLARALELKLKKEGYLCDVVYDGEQALEKLNENKYDLLIADIMMPKKNGFEVIENMPALNSKIPKIIASNLGQEEDKRRALKLGATKYFVKADTPLSDVVKYIQELLSAVPVEKK